MNAAYLTALAGVAGVLLGALISGVMQWLTERRREWAKARVAAGFIRAELAGSQIALVSALDTKRWWIPQIAPSFTAWQEWAGPLLTGSATRAGRLHSVELLLLELNAPAAHAYKTFDAAKQRLDAARKSKDKAEEDEAAKAVRSALAGLALTEAQQEQIGAALKDVQTAMKDVPAEKLPPLARRLIPAVAIGLVLAAVAVGAVLEVNHYEDTTVTANDVANSVGAVRGAAEASCSPVNNVQNAYSCELTYVIPDPPPPSAPACNLASTTASLPTGPRTVASTSTVLALTKAEPPCETEVVTQDDVWVDPYKDFMDRAVAVAVNSLANGARNVTSRQWKAKHTEIVTGKVKTG